MGGADDMKGWWCEFQRSAGYKQFAEDMLLSSCHSIPKFTLEWKGDSIVRVYRST